MVYAILTLPPELSAGWSPSGQIEVYVAHLQAWRVAQPETVSGGAAHVRHEPGGHQLGQAAHLLR
jgi:hypothetical protein